jgi:hypothetical protein
MGPPPRPVRDRPARPGGERDPGAEGRRHRGARAEDRDVVRACADFYDEIVDDKASAAHDHPALDAAVEGAKKRNVGDGCAWDRKQGAVISPLYAVTFARWAAARAGEVSVYGFGELELCDACGINPHEDPDGEHDYRCIQCREEDE